MEKLASNEVMEERLTAKWQEAQRAAEALAKQALSRLRSEDEAAAPASTQDSSSLSR